MSSNQPSRELLDEFIAADAQGERVVGSLWPDDQFLYKGEFHTIAKMQLAGERRIAVVTTGGRTFLFDAFVMFPALLSDEHFEAENPDREVW